MKIHCKRTNISVLIPTKNESRNISRCLNALKGWADEIVVIDSQSMDGTIEIAESFGAKIVQFHYSGGWPKKRQWALDTLEFSNDWILLLDADEILLDPIKHEIKNAIAAEGYNGYWLKFQIFFLGRQLRYGDTELLKLFLFRRGKGRYEKRLEFQDSSTLDIEIHEHVVVDGRVGHLKNPVQHENLNDLDRYIQKHNEYSNWEAHVLLFGDTETSLTPSFFGTQAQRRRWLKTRLFIFPGSPLLFFFYKFIFRRGFLDGVPGFIYCLFQAIQLFHIKAKLYELSLKTRKQN